MFKRLLKKKEKTFGLALGSGGAKGLSHIAFIKALAEMGIRPSVIAGTSIGAVIGAFTAAGMTGVQMEEILHNMGFTDIPKLVDWSPFRKTSMLKGKGVEDFLLKNLPVRKFDELAIPLKIVTTDFWNRREVVLDSGDLVPAIRASLSLPVIFDPVKLDGQVLMDGGMVNPLPYDIIRDECDVVIAIDVSGEKSPPEHDPLPNMFESLMSSFQIMQASIVNAKMDTARPDISVKPALNNIRMLEFHRYQEIMGGVKKDVRHMKQEIRKSLKEKSFIAGVLNNARR